MVLNKKAPLGAEFGKNKKKKSPAGLLLDKGHDLLLF
jgi:hypothetical protein